MTSTPASNYDFIRGLKLGWHFILIKNFFLLSHFFWLWKRENILNIDSFRKWMFHSKFISLTVVYCRVLKRVLTSMYGKLLWRRTKHWEEIRPTPFNGVLYDPRIELWESRCAKKEVVSRARGHTFSLWHTCVVLVVAFAACDTRSLPVRDIPWVLPISIQKLALEKWRYDDALRYALCI